MRTRPRGIERGRDRIASRAGPSGPHRIVSRASAREGLAPTTTPLTSGHDQPPSAWTSRAPIRPYSPSRPSAQSATRSPLARRGAPQPAARSQPLRVPTTVGPYTPKRPPSTPAAHASTTGPPPARPAGPAADGRRPGTSQPIAFQRMQNWRFHHQSGEGPAAAGPVGACAPDPAPSTPPGPTPPPPAGLAGPTASRPPGHDGGHVTVTRRQPRRRRMRSPSTQAEGTPPPPFRWGACPRFIVHQPVGGCARQPTVAGAPHRQGRPPPAWADRGRTSAACAPHATGRIVRPRAAAVRACETAGGAGPQRAGSQQGLRAPSPFLGSSSRAGPAPRLVSRACHLGESGGRVGNPGGKERGRAD